MVGVAQRLRGGYVFAPLFSNIICTAVLNAAEEMLLMGVVEVKKMKTQLIEPRVIPQPIFIVGRKGGPSNRWQTTLNTDCFGVVRSIKITSSG